MIPFLEAAFGAEAMGVHKSPEGTVLHATIRIGNATLEIDEAHGEFQPMPCHLHVYVPDTDAAYARALQLGATSIEAPRNAPYGDRAAGVKDAFGHSWFIATYLDGSGGLKTRHSNVRNLAEKGRNILAPLHKMQSMMPAGANSVLAQRRHRERNVVSF